MNGVCPGPIWGPALQGYLGGMAADAASTCRSCTTSGPRETALRYLVPPEEIAGTVVYLASDLARPVTGQAIYTGAGQWFH